MDDLTFNFEVIESKKDIDIGILIYDSTYINFLKLQNEKYYKIDSQTKLTDLDMAFLNNSNTFVQQNNEPVNEEPTNKGIQNNTDFLNNSDVPF
jgi:hypothetical protein